MLFVSSLGLFIPFVAAKTIFEKLVKALLSRMNFGGIMFLLDERTRVPLTIVHALCAKCFLEACEWASLNIDKLIKQEFFLCWQILVAIFSKGEWDRK